MVTEEFASKVKKIGCVLAEGVFTVGTFQNTLYAGTYDYNGNRNFIYVYNPDTKIWKQGPYLELGESVCAMIEFKGSLYVNTENRGQVYRLENGRWIQVLQGKKTIGCGFTIKDGYLYATNSNFTHILPGGYIYRTFDGTHWGGTDGAVYKAEGVSSNIRNIVAYKGKLYAFSNDQYTKASWFLVSNDGSEGSWEHVYTNMIDPSVTENFRPYRAIVSNDGYLWITSAKMFSDTGESAIYRFDGKNLKKVYADPNKTHISDILEFNGVLFATTIRDTDGSVGGGTLIMSDNGGQNWETVHTFAEAEARSLAVLNGKFYVRTKQKKGKGCVYEFDISKVRKFTAIANIINMLLLNKKKTNR